MSTPTPVGQDVPWHRHDPPPLIRRTPSGNRRTTPPGGLDDDDGTRQTTDDPSAPREVKHQRRRAWRALAHDRPIRGERLVSPLRSQLQQPLDLPPSLRHLAHQPVRRRANPPGQLSEIDPAPLIAFFGSVPVDVEVHPPGGQRTQELCENDGVDEMHVPVL